MSKPIRALLALAILLVLVAILSRALGRSVENVVVPEEHGVEIRLAASSPKSPLPDSEYLTLALAPKDGEVLAATGWRLSAGTHEVVLPGVNPLFIQGAVNEELPLVVTRPGTLIVSTGRSPLGVSFRENKCMSLLATFQTFTPPLSASCSNCNEKTASYPDYNACVAAHKGEPDFFLPAWRIYLDSETELWRNAVEVIKLFDQNGKLLGIASY